VELLKFRLKAGTRRKDVTVRNAAPARRKEVLVKALELTRIIN
jgi:hypothetical protein